LTTAEEFVARLRGGGAEIRRASSPPSVFLMTRDEQLVEWLVRLGARVHGKYERNPAGAKFLGEELITEWDVVITQVQVEGDLWEAAKHDQ
jgi:hypothetical protein